MLLPSQLLNSRGVTLYLCAQGWLGKTTWMQAIGHYRWKFVLASKVFYVEQFTNDLITSIRKR